MGVDIQLELWVGAEGRAELINVPRLGPGTGVSS